MDLMTKKQLIQKISNDQKKILIKIKKTEKHIKYLENILKTKQYNKGIKYINNIFNKNYYGLND